MNVGNESKNEDFYAKWIYLAAIFIVLLIMVIVFQLFDAVENAGYIASGAFEKKMVGWGLLVLQIAMVLKASRYWKSDVRKTLTYQERRKQNIGVIITLTIFVVLLIAFNLIDVGAWLFRAFS